MDAKVVWSHGLSFTGVADSGFTVAVGADPSVGGDDDGMRPMELLLTGLAGCTAMDVISILTKKRQQVTGFEVRAHAERAAEHPKVFTAIHLHYVVRGRGVDPVAVQRAMELSETKYCPAQAMFSQIMPITMSYEVIEDTPVAVQA
jgi:putative redox protein